MVRRFTSYYITGKQVEVTEIDNRREWEARNFLHWYHDDEEEEEKKETGRTFGI